MRVLMLVLAAAALSMGQRCPTEPSTPPCALTPAPEFTQADLDRARETGYAAGQEACPSAPEPEPCPICDVTTNDDQVRDEAVDRFVADILHECRFGSSVADNGDIDREVKRRIQNLHQYGYCR